MHSPVFVVFVLCRLIITPGARLYTRPSITDDRWSGSPASLLLQFVDQL